MYCKTEYNAAQLFVYKSIKSVQFRVKDDFKLNAIKETMDTGLLETGMRDLGRRCYFVGKIQFQCGCGILEQVESSSEQTKK